jgi:hypothetical protein
MKKLTKQICQLFKSEVTKELSNLNWKNFKVKINNDILDQNTIFGKHNYALISIDFLDTRNALYDTSLSFNCDLEVSSKIVVNTFPYVNRGDSLTTQVKIRPLFSAVIFDSEIEAKLFWNLTKADVKFIESRIKSLIQIK